MAQKNAITPTRQENFPEWYQQVIKNSNLAENSPVRGCMIIKPWGYSIWENIQQVLDKMFKDTGHSNAYFPLLIPLSFLEKEAKHVDGFAKECAVVTHHKLEQDENGKLVPAGKLEEPLIIRPTSETIIGDAYSKWVQSYRDLPILINQWANVMRWEMRTRLFLRTSEFLWQEGHTVHATKEEAIEETLKMLDVYETFARDYLAIPVIKGEKTPEERFPGAENTYTIEAIMQDKKALQAGTSHFLGQNFAKGSDIKFTDENGEIVYAWTTSWGVSTRLIGGLIMSHSDDDGLVLPPRIAPEHVVIIPIFNKTNEKEILDYAYKVKGEILKVNYNNSNVKVFVDNSSVGSGQKFWSNVKHGVPIRVEIGKKELADTSLTISRRDSVNQKDKENFSLSDFKSKVSSILEEIQNNIYNKALKLKEENIKDINNIDEFKKYFSTTKDSGFVVCYSDKEINEEREELLKELKISARCIPFEFNQNNNIGKCIFTGKNTKTKIIYARSY